MITYRDLGDQLVDLPDPSMSNCPMSRCAHYGLYDICYGDNSAFPECPLFEAMYEKMDTEKQQLIDSIFINSGGAYPDNK